MSKRFAKVVSYLLVIALVMQDGLPAAAANNLTGRAERMTALENDSGGVSDKEEADDKASNNKALEEENADKETPSEEQSEDKKTQEEEKQDDEASDNEEQSEDKTSEDEQSENKTSEDKTSEEESAAENESSDDKQTTTEESSETETDIKITETETESETKATETDENETEIAVEEKTVKAEEEMDEDDLFDDLPTYPGDIIELGENMLPEDVFKKQGDNLEYWTISNDMAIEAIEPGTDSKSVTVKFKDENLGADWQPSIKLTKDGFKLENGHAYVISYEIVSTKDRVFQSGFDGTSDRDEHRYSLKAGEIKNIKYKITPNGEWANLMFYLGKVGEMSDIGEHSITISNLSIQEAIIKLADGDAVEENPDNLLKNGTFKDGDTDGWIVNNTNATVKTAKYKVAFDITGNNADYMTWLRQNDITFSESSRYEITFDITSTIDRWIIAGSDGGTWLQEQELKAGIPTSVKYQVTGMRGNNFVIALGSNFLNRNSTYQDWEGNEVTVLEPNRKQNLASHRVTISNVCITEELPELEDDEDVGDEIEGNLLKNGKFKDGNTDSWIVSQGSTTTVKKGKIAFDIASGTTKDSDIFLKQDLNLEKDKKYTITFKAQSTINRKIMLGCDDTAWLKPYELQAGENTVSYEVSGVGGNNFIIALGSDLRANTAYTEYNGDEKTEVSVGETKTQELKKHRVILSDICIVEGLPEFTDGTPVDENPDNLLTNGTFKNGTTEGWDIKNANTTVRNAKYKVAFDIKGPQADWEVWLRQDIELSKGVKYKITFDAESTIDRDILVGSDGGTWLKPQHLEAGKLIKVSYEVRGMSGNNFTIALGSNLRATSEYQDWTGNTVPSSAAKNQTLPLHRITISNVCIIAMPTIYPDTPNDTLPAKITNLNGYDGWTPSELAPLKDGNFVRSVEVTRGDNIQVTSPENAIWSLWHEHWDGADWVKCMPPDKDGDGVKIWLANTGDADPNSQGEGGNRPWDVQLKQQISLRAGKQYILSFKVHSEKERSINVSIADIDKGEAWVKPIAIKKDEAREVVLKLPVLTENADNKTFMIQMGHLEGMPDVKDNTLTFTDMKLEINGYSELAERITDGYFNEGAQGNFTVAANDKAEVSFKDSYIYADILSDCKDSDVTVSSGKFNILGNAREYQYQYEISFVAGATENRTMKAALVDSIGNVLQEQSLDLTTEAKKYLFTYNPVENKNNVSLKLMLGGGKGTVCVDTVRCDLKGYPTAVGLDTEAHDISILRPESVPVISEMPADQAVEGNNIIISFDKQGNETYKDKINKILIDDKEVADDKYTIGERTGVNGRNDEYIITLDKSLFDVNGERQTYTIEVRAPFYQNNKLHQTVYTKSLWENTWLEEFDGTQLDLSKWSYQIGRGDNNDGWGNREQQYYTDDPRNLSVENGELVITARKDRNDTAAPYSSARIWTMNDDGKTAKFSQKYGRMEAKMKIDAGKGYQGIWPAFWMLPVDLKYGTWPLSGEIDILEARGREPNLADGTVHFGKPYPNNENSGGVFDFNKSEYNQDSDISEYHIYAVEWEPGEIRWYVDDELYFKESNWYCQSFDNPEKFRYPAPFDQNFYIILNLAIGGMFDNDLKPADDKMPAEMKVDYVRVYKSVNDYDENVDAPVITKDDKKTPYDEDVKSELMDTEFTGTNIVTKDGESLKRNVWNLVMLPSFGGSANFATITKDGKTYAKITPTQLGSAAHSIQLIQHLDLVKGYYYRISFDAWTEGNRNLNMKIGQDGTEGWNAYQTFETALTESPKRYQCEFQAKVTDLHSRVEFNLATSNCPVYIGNIQYEVIDEIIVDPDAEKAPSEDGNCVYNGSFNIGSVGGLDYWHVDGSDGKTKRDEEGDYWFTATKGNLYQNGLELLKNDSYQLTFRAKATEERQVDVILSDKEGKTEYYREKVTLTPGEKVHELTFNMTRDTDTNARLCFVFGDGSSKIDITGIRLVRTTYNNVNWDEIVTYPLRNGDFALGDKYWTTWATSFSIKEENGNPYAEVQAKKGGNKWDATFGNDGVSFTANTEYEFSFRAKASKAGESVRLTIQEGAPSYYAHFSLNEVELDTDWKTYTYEIKFREPHNDLSLTFSVAGASEDYQFCIDDVVLRAKGAPKAPGIIEAEKYNRLGTDIVLSYHGEKDWEQNAEVYIDDKKVDSNKAVFADGKLTLDKSVFSESKTYTLVVRSNGYSVSKGVELTIYPANGNLILNGDFSYGNSGLDYWATYALNDPRDCVTTENNVAKIHYSEIAYSQWGPASWCIQLNQENIPVKRNQKYQLSFFARATMPRWIQIVCTQDKEQSKYVEITKAAENLERYTIELETVDSDTLKLGFFLSTVGANGDSVANADPNDWPAHDIYLDDICLIEIPESGVIEVDKSILEGLVKEYADLNNNQGLYTTKTYTVFQKAYADAETILAKADADQIELIQAENNLRSAVKGLQKRGDKTALQDLIKTAEASYKEEDYTAASWKTFQEALDAAKKMLEEEEAAQEEINKACDALTRAGNGLVSKELVNGLKNLVAECQMQTNDGYSADSWKRFENAIKRAKTVAENAEATKDEITSAQKNLESAKEALEWDKADLKKLISESDSLAEKDYTPESWKEFSDVLANAKAVEKNKSASKDEIAGAREKLETAKAALRPNKIGLKELIEKAESLNKNKYTAESWARVAEALKAAQEVMDNPDATKEQVDTAYTALDKAQKQLIPRQVTVEDLNMLTAECESLNAEGYTSDTWERFSNALSKAKEVAGKQDATQEERNAAYIELVDARAALTADKTKLTSLIDECDELNKTDYEEDIWIPFEVALENAKKAQENLDASPQDVKDAYNTLLQKKDDLLKAKLRKVIDECDRVEQEYYYLPEKWEAFNKALEDAKTVIGKENVTKAEIDNAIKALHDTLTDLRDNEKEGLWAFDIADVLYTGKAVKPAVTVYNGRTLLVEKKDYTITYKNNIKVSKKLDGGIPDGYDASKRPCIVIKGKGNYSGSFEQTFDIIPNDFSLKDDIIIQNIYVKAPKNGKSITPAPVVTRNGKKLSKKEYEIGTIKKLKKGDDAEELAEELVEKVEESGEYIVEVKGVPQKGYDGSQQIKMFVLNDNQKLMSTVKVTNIKNIPYTGEIVTPNFTVKDGKRELVKDVDYNVTCKSWQVGTAMATITGIGGTYIGEKTVTFKITGTALKAKDVTVMGVPQIYSGSAIEPTVQVNVAGKTLTSTDYVVSYDKNTKAGNAVVIVTGIGQYTGMVKKTFKITPFDLSSNDGDLLTYKTTNIVIPYAKGGSKLTEDDLAITFNNTRLTEGIDYTLIYKKNTKVTTDETKASVKIKGKGNFKGTTAEIFFEIKPQELENLRNNITVMDVLEKKATTYNRVTPIIKDLNGKALKKGTDFEIAGYYPTKESDTPLTETPKVNDTVYVAIKAKEDGNYAGEVREPFRIIGNNKDISKAKVKVDSSIFYTGNEIQLSGNQIMVTMKDVENPLKEGEDYKIVDYSYSNNINKGTGKVTIQGVNSYGGTKTVTFKINAHDFDMTWYENYYSRFMSWFNEAFSQ